MKLSRFSISALSGCLAFAMLFGATESCADVYELRIYKTKEGKLDALNARFRDHTMRLFTKHGIDSIVYWVPTDEDASHNTLI